MHRLVEKIRVRRVRLVFGNRLMRRRPAQDGGLAGKLLAETGKLSVEAGFVVVPVVLQIVCGDAGQFLAKAANGFGTDIAGCAPQRVDFVTKCKRISCHNGGVDFLEQGLRVGVKS